MKITQHRIRVAQGCSNQDGNPLEKAASSCISISIWKNTLTNPPIANLHERTCATYMYIRLHAHALRTHS